MYIKKTPNTIAQERIIYNYVSKVYIDNDFYEVNNDLKVFSKLIDNDRKKFYKLFNVISHIKEFENKEKLNLLDIGCGGGVNVERFAGQISNEGKVIGLDYSDVSVEKSSKRNEEFINEGKVEIIEGSVSDMPFEDKTFDIVTGFETIYFWPDFVNDLKEVNRVLKKGGLVFFCNEVVYKKGEMEKYDDLAKLLDMNIYSEEVLEESLTEAGFGDFETHINEENDWIVILARKN